MDPDHAASFKDKIAVITGGSSGVGEAIAQALVARGAILHNIDCRPPSFEPASPPPRERYTFHMTDLENDSDIARCAAELQQECPQVDVLVHSAGIIAMARIAEAQVQDFDRQYRINVRAPYALTQALLPLLRGALGQVVFINSSAWMNARATLGQYAATKYALTAVADTLREEVNPDGIRVLSMFLGRTATPMQANVHRTEGKQYHPERLLQPADVAEVVLHALGLSRTAEITEIKLRQMTKTT